MTDDNYIIALNTLKKEYLDVDYIRDELLKQINSKVPSYDIAYIKTKHFLAEIKNILHDLAKHYDCDLLTKSSGGYIFVSQIVFSKLSNEMQ